MEAKKYLPPAQGCDQRLADARLRSDRGNTLDMGGGVNRHRQVTLNRGPRESCRMACKREGKGNEKGDKEERGV